MFPYQHKETASAQGNGSPWAAWQIALSGAQLQSCVAFKGTAELIEAVTHVQKELMAFATLMSVSVRQQATASPLAHPSTMNSLTRICQTNLSLRDYLLNAENKTSHDLLLCHEYVKELMEGCLTYKAFVDLHSTEIQTHKDAVRSLNNAVHLLLIELWEIHAIVTQQQGMLATVTDTLLFAPAIALRYYLKAMVNCAQYAKTNQCPVDNALLATCRSNLSLFVLDHYSDLLTQQSGLFDAAAQRTMLLQVSLLLQAMRDLAQVSAGFEDAAAAKRDCEAIANELSALCHQFFPVTVHKQYTAFRAYEKDVKTSFGSLIPLIAKLRQKEKAQDIDLFIQGGESVLSSYNNCLSAFNELIMSNVLLASDYRDIGSVVTKMSLYPEKIILFVNEVKKSAAGNLSRKQRLQLSSLHLNMLVALHSTHYLSIRANNQGVSVVNHDTSKLSDEYQTAVLSLIMDMCIDYRNLCVTVQAIVAHRQLLPSNAQSSVTNYINMVNHVFFNCVSSSIVMLFEWQDKEEPLPAEVVAIMHEIRNKLTELYHHQHIQPHEKKIVLDALSDVEKCIPGSREFLLPVNCARKVNNKLDDTRSCLMFEVDLSKVALPSMVTNTVFLSTLKNIQTMVDNIHSIIECIPDKLSGKDPLSALSMFTLYQEKLAQYASILKPTDTILLCPVNVVNIEHNVRYLGSYYDQYYHSARGLLTLAEGLLNFYFYKIGGGANGMKVSEDPSGQFTLCMNILNDKTHDPYPKIFCLTMIMKALSTHANERGNAALLLDYTKQLHDVLCVSRHGCYLPFRHEMLNLLKCTVADVRNTLQQCEKHRTDNEAERVKITSAYVRLSAIVARLSIDSQSEFLQEISTLRQAITDFPLSEVPISAVDHDLEKNAVVVAPVASLPDAITMSPYQDADVEIKLNYVMSCLVRTSVLLAEPDGNHESVVLLDTLKQDADHLRLMIDMVSKYLSTHSESIITLDKTATQLNQVLVTLAEMAGVMDRDPSVKRDGLPLIYLMSSYCLLGKVKCAFLTACLLEPLDDEVALGESVVTFYSQLPVLLKEIVRYQHTGNQCVADDGRDRFYISARETLAFLMGDIVTFMQKEALAQQWKVMSPVIMENLREIVDVTKQVGTENSISLASGQRFFNLMYKQARALSLYIDKVKTSIPLRATEAAYVYASSDAKRLHALDPMTATLFKQMHKSLVTLRQLLPTLSKAMNSQKRTQYETLLVNQNAQLEKWRQCMVSRHTATTGAPALCYFHITGTDNVLDTADLLAHTADSVELLLRHCQLQVNLRQSVLANAVMVAHVDKMSIDVSDCPVQTQFAMMLKLNFINTYPMILYQDKFLGQTALTYFQHLLDYVNTQGMPENQAVQSVMKTSFATMSRTVTALCKNSDLAQENPNLMAKLTALKAQFFPVALHEKNMRLMLAEEQRELKRRTEDKAKSQQLRNDKIQDKRNKAAAAKEKAKAKEKHKKEARLKMKHQPAAEVKARREPLLQETSPVTVIAIPEQQAQAQQSPLTLVKEPVKQVERVDPTKTVPIEQAEFRPRSFSAPPVADVDFFLFSERKSTMVAVHASARMPDYRYSQSCLLFKKMADDKPVSGNNVYQPVADATGNVILEKMKIEPLSR